MFFIHIGQPILATIGGVAAGIEIVDIHSAFFGDVGDRLLPQPGQLHRVTPKLRCTSSRH
jgi:hypothetical protein